MKEKKKVFIKYIILLRYVRRAIKNSCVEVTSRLKTNTINGLLLTNFPYVVYRHAPSSPFINPPSPSPTSCPPPPPLPLYILLLTKKLYYVYISNCSQTTIGNHITHTHTHTHNTRTSSFNMHNQEYEGVNRIVFRGRELLIFKSGVK